MNEKKITISDIANAAGVSKATVSYILNKRQSGFKISTETTLRVLEICEKLHYKRDEVAVLLANCRKHPVQLLVLSPWLYSQFSDFMVQVNRALENREKEAKLDVSYSSYSNGSLNKVLRASIIKKYDAIFVLGTSLEDDKWLLRNAKKLPNVILVNRYIPGFFSAYGNDKEAMCSLLDNVDIDYYRSIVEFTSSHQSYCNNRRHMGFCATIEKNGKKIIPFADEYNSVWDSVSEMMQKNPGPFLVFIPRYIHAARLLTAALNAGIKVPDELGIITYDRHSLLTEFITPALTTVNPQLEKIANAGIDIACSLRNNMPVKNVIIPAKIIPGETVRLKNCNAKNKK